MSNTTLLRIAALITAAMLCACERESATPQAAANPNAKYTVTLPAGFAQSFDGDAPTDFGELRLGDLVVVENRTGDRISASFERQVPMSAVGDSLAALRSIPIPSNGRISGPELDLAAAASVTARFTAVTDASWGGFALWQPDPWGRRFVVDRDEASALRVSTSIFIPPEDLQPPISLAPDWNYDADAGEPGEFRLFIGDCVVIENALGHRIRATIELNFINQSIATMVVLPSRGVAVWDAPHTPLWMKVAFLQVPMLNDPAASTPTRAFESRVSDEGLTVRFARDADGEVTTDFHQGIDP